MSDKQIALHASEGQGFDEIQRALGVATQCGRCEDCAREIIDRCHAQSAITRQGWMPVAVSLSR